MEHFKEKVKKLLDLVKTQEQKLKSSLELADAKKNENETRYKKIMDILDKIQKKIQNNNIE